MPARSALFRLVVPAMILAVGCAQNTATKPAAKPAAGQPAGLSLHLDPATTVATIDGVPVTGAQLEEKISGELGQMETEFTEKLTQLRKEALESLILETVLDREAKAKGVDRETLLKTEIESQAKEPSEAEMQAAYDKYVKGRFDVSFEDAKPQIKQQLMREQNATRARAYFEELKTKYKVKTSLPQPPIKRVEVAAVGQAKGGKNAKVTIVEFSDFECPFCSRANPAIDQVMKTYGDQVKVVFRHYPLPFHKKAPKASEAALCAADEGKFWEMHDRLFANQDKIDVEDLKAHARALNLDGAKFDACLDSGMKAPFVEKDLADGKKAGVNGTPAFFINGRLISGAQPFEAFKEVIDEELAAK